jgi:hypothetical protein
MSDAVLIAVIVTIGSVVTATISGFALYQATQTHKLINSRMDELLALTRSEARAEGVAAGQAQREQEE